MMRATAAAAPAPAHMRVQPQRALTASRALRASAPQCRRVAAVSAPTNALHTQTPLDVVQAAARAADIELPLLSEDEKYITAANLPQRTQDTAAAAAAAAGDVQTLAMRVDSLQQEVLARQAAFLTADVLGRDATAAAPAPIPAGGHVLFGTDHAAIAKTERILTAILAHHAPTPAKASDGELLMMQAPRSYGSRHNTRANRTDRDQRPMYRHVPEDARILYTGAQWAALVKEFPFLRQLSSMDCRYWPSGVSVSLAALHAAFTAWFEAHHWARVIVTCSREACGVQEDVLASNAVEGSDILRVQCGEFRVTAYTSVKLPGWDAAKPMWLISPYHLSDFSAKGAFSQFSGVLLLKQLYGRELVQTELTKLQQLAAASIEEYRAPLRADLQSGEQAVRTNDCCDPERSTQAAVLADLLDPRLAADVALLLIEDLLSYGTLLESLRLRGGDSAFEQLFQQVTGQSVSQVTAHALLLVVAELLENGVAAALALLRQMLADVRREAAAGAGAGAGSSQAAGAGSSRQGNSRQGSSLVFDAASVRACADSFKQRAKLQGPCAVCGSDRPGANWCNGPALPEGGGLAVLCSNHASMWRRKGKCSLQALKEHIADQPAKLQGPCTACGSDSPGPGDARWRSGPALPEGGGLAVLCNTHATMWHQTLKKCSLQALKEHIADVTANQPAKKLQGPCAACGSDSPGPGDARWKNGPALPEGGGLAVLCAKHASTWRQSLKKCSLQALKQHIANQPAQPAKKQRWA